MKLLQRTTKYLLIIIIGVCLAFFVARIQYDTEDLSASVLSLTEQDFFESTSRDAWYKKEWEIFEVFLAEPTRNEWKLTVSILYSPEKIERFIDQLQTPYVVENVGINEWNISLEISWYENWNFTEWIFQIPYIWDPKDITLEYIKSNNINFAIWNLDNIDPDNQSH